MAVTSLVLNVVAVIALVDAVRHARWSAPLTEYRVWATATIVAALLQRARFPFGHGLELHYLGAAWLALMLGYPRALVSMAAILAVQWAMGWTTTKPLAVEFLVGAVLPAWIMFAVVRAGRRWLPANPFVFFIGIGLWGIALVNSLQVLLDTFATPAASAMDGWTLWHQFIPARLLLGWGEALVEAMMTTVVIVFLPGTVRLFDETHYRKPPD